MEIFQGAYGVAWLVAGLTLVLVFGFAADRDALTRVGSLPSELWLSLTMALVVSLPVGLVGIALADLYLTFEWSESALRSDLASGRLGLRITSLLLGLKSLIFTYEWLQADRAHPRSNRLPGLGDIAEQVDDTTIQIRVSSQYAIYLAAALVLWSLYVSDASIGTAGLVLSWGLFFVADDWNIIADYITSLKGRFLRWHFFKIEAFNVLLVGALTVVTWREFRWFGAAVSSSFVLTAGALHAIMIVPTSSSEDDATAVA